MSKESGEFLARPEGSEVVSHAAAQEHWGHRNSKCRGPEGQSVMSSRNKKTQALGQGM